MHNYNHMAHRSLGQWTPASVVARNESEARYCMCLAAPKVSNKPASYKYELGNNVRISYIKSTFARDYHQKWTNEIFVIDRRYKRDGMPIYVEYDGESIIGMFNKRELQVGLV